LDGVCSLGKTKLIFKYGISILDVYQSDDRPQAITLAVGRLHGPSKNLVRASEIPPPHTCRARQVADFLSFNNEITTHPAAAHGEHQDSEA